MVDVVLPAQVGSAGEPRRRTSLKQTMQRKSRVAFLMALRLLLLISLLALYPALYSLYLATLNKSMQRFIGIGKFTSLFKRETFWMVVRQSCIFALTAVFFKALIGFDVLRRRQQLAPLIIYAFLMDYYIAGLTAGATKG
jgi:multiple sugar transport system permease protein